MTLRRALKRFAQALALVTVMPAAALSGFGRIRTVYLFFAESYSLVPGIVGSFIRAAYYRLTLRDSHIDINIGLGTVMVSPQAGIGTYTSIGNYCVIGRVRIGHHTQIASHVEIPSGRRQHSRDRDGNLLPATESEVAIGNRCWLGASCVVLASVGDGSTIGAGAVVVKEIPAGVTAAGNPARPLP